MRRITMGSIGSISKPSNIGIVVITSIIIIALIIDTSAINLSHFISDQPFPNLDLAIFTVIVLCCMVGQYLILGFINRKSKENSVGEQPKLKLIQKVVFVSQYSLTAILVFIILQMIVTSGYDISLVKAVIWISHSLFIILMGLLTQRFLSWFRFNRNSVVLVYFFTIVMLLINAIFTILYVGQQLVDSPTYVQSNRGPVMSFESPDTIFNSGYVVTSVLSFILTWVATVLLLRHYGTRLGRIKYWIMVSIPLVYFLSQFQPIFLNVFTSFRLSGSSSLWYCLHINFQCDQTSRRNFIWYCVLECSLGALITVQ